MYKLIKIAHGDHRITVLLQDYKDLLLIYQKDRLQLIIYCIILFCKKLKKKKGWCKSNCGFHHFGRDAKTTPT